MKQILDGLEGNKRHDREFDEDSIASIKNVSDPLYTEEVRYQPYENLIAFPRQVSEHNFNQSDKELGTYSIEKFQLNKQDSKLDQQNLKKAKEQSLLSFNPKDQNRSQVFEELIDYFAAIFSPSFNQDIFMNSQLCNLKSPKKQSYQKCYIFYSFKLIF